MIFFNTPPALAEVIGMTGFALYVMNYTMLTLHLVCSKTVRYFAVNLTAASCVMVGLTASFNLPSAMIQGFFITISTVGIIIRLRRSYSDRTQMTELPTYRPAAVRRTVSNRDAFGGWVPKNLSPGSGMRAKNSAPRKGS